MSGTLRWLRRVPAWVTVAVIRGYQLVVSVWFPPTCRFYPSCSAYAITALERHGLVRGGWLAARRLTRCHPWNPGGVDHVPAPSDCPSVNRPPSERRRGLPA